MLLSWKVERGPQARECAKPHKRQEEIFPRASRKKTGFPGGTIDKESSCQCRRHKRHRFDPWVRKIPWRRAQRHIPVFLSGESHDRGAWWAMVHRFAKGQN